MRETRRYLGLELAGAKNQKTAVAAIEFYPREKKIFLLDIYDRVSGYRSGDDSGEASPSQGSGGHHGAGEHSSAGTHSSHRGGHVGATHAQHGGHGGALGTTQRSGSHPSGTQRSGGTGARKASGASKILSPTGAYGLTTSGDEALVELLHELVEDAGTHTILGVNVPLELPPAISACTGKGCVKPNAATTAAIKWMRDAHRKAERGFKSEAHDIRVTEYTTYTQRPVELWIRYQVMPKLPATHRFEIDEALGGNKAPLTARMHFIRRHLGNLPVLEAWPKLTVALLALDLEIPKRVIQSYRKLEEGVHAREQILELLAERHDIFIYERDIRKLAHSLPAFDAFLCAYTAFLKDTQRCAKAPTGFPVATGWVEYPL